MTKFGKVIKKVMAKVSRSRELSKEYKEMLLVTDAIYAGLKEGLRDGTNPAIKELVMAVNAALDEMSNDEVDNHQINADKKG